MKICLVPLNGGTEFEIARPLSIVGRREDADLLVAHKSVSKQHCVLLHTEGMLFLRDLGSTNGTRVNGQRVRRAALLPNDRLSFAGIPFQVRFGDAAIDVGSTQHVHSEEAFAGREASVDSPEGEDDAPANGVAVVQNHLPDVIPEVQRKAKG